MAKLDVLKDQLWTNSMLKIVASYGYKLATHSLVDTTEQGMTSAVYRFTLTCDMQQVAYKLVISVEEIEGPPKKGNLYCFSIGPTDDPGNLSNLLVPVTITVEEFFILIDNIVLATMCYMVSIRINDEMLANVEQLTRDIKDKKDLSNYVGINKYVKVDNTLSKVFPA